MTTIELGSTQELKERIGKNVRRLRREQGLTQVELATLLSRHQTGISHIERGRRQIDVSTMLELCVALGVGVEKVLQ